MLQAIRPAIPGHNPAGLVEASRWSFRVQGETTTGSQCAVFSHPGGMPDGGVQPHPTATTSPGTGTHREPI